MSKGYITKLLRPFCWLFRHNPGSTGGYYEGYQCERCGKWGIDSREDELKDKES